MTPIDSEIPCINTDRELFRQIEGDYYSPSVSVTERGGIQMHFGGLVVGKSIEEWHSLVSKCQSCGGSMFYGPDSIEQHSETCPTNPQQIEERLRMATKKPRALKEPVAVFSVVEIKPWKYKLIDSLCVLLRLGGEVFVLRVKETGFTMDDTDYTHVKTGIKMKRSLVESK